MAERECHTEKKTVCNKELVDVTKMVEKTKCEEVCVPTKTKECHREEAREECRMVPKTVSYKVPKLRCGKTLVYRPY